MVITNTDAFNRSISRVLITEAEIKAKIQETAAMVDREYEGKPLLLVSILKGAFVFMADFCREVKIPCEIGFMAAQSYFDGTSPQGEVEITLDLAQDISQYHVLIMEDIVDTGRTLSLVVDMLKSRNPLSLKVITLLDKPARRKVKFEPDVSMFTIPDLFVIGYGLDCGEYYRTLPYIAEYCPGNNEEDAS